MQCPAASVTAVDQSRFFGAIVKRGAWMGSSPARRAAQDARIRVRIAHLSRIPARRVGSRAAGKRDADFVATSAADGA